MKDMKCMKKTVVRVFFEFLHVLHDLHGKYRIRLFTPLLEERQS